MFRFADPWLLALGLVIPALIWRHIRPRSRRAVTLRYSNLDTVRSVSGRAPLHRHLLFGLRLLGLACLILALARPQSGSRGRDVTTEGIDIMLALDISSSMLAEDFKPHNRLETAKQVAGDFIKSRISDRIGMVVFARESYTQCPLTLDYGVLLNFMQEIQVGKIEDGTAIGLAIANAVNRLRESRAESRIVILLTDGRNNAGELHPLTAARAARAMNVRVYTVGAGSRGTALYPIQDPVLGKRYVRLPVEIDEELLRSVAENTQGRYFRAVDKTSLEEVFAEIGRLEKSRIDVREYTRYEELFASWLLAGLLLTGLVTVLSRTWFKTIP